MTKELHYRLNPNFILDLYCVQYFPLLSVKLKKKKRKINEKLNEDHTQSKLRYVFIKSNKKKTNKYIPVFLLELSIFNYQSPFTISYYKFRPSIPTSFLVTFSWFYFLFLDFYLKTTKNNPFIVGIPFSQEIKLKSIRPRKKKFIHHSLTHSLPSKKDGRR